MAEIILRNGKKVGDFQEPYIVAEANSSHNGDVATAKMMVMKAATAGCDCIKFQSWSAETLYSKAYYNLNPISERMVKKFSLSFDEQKELSDYCRECGIDFASTPYSKEEVDFLVDECNVPFVKIASMELNNYPFLEYIALKQVPIVLATGMGEWDEIAQAVAEIERTGNRNLCILHCVSSYPAKYEQMNLLNIKSLKKAYPQYAVGLSDHSLGTECAVAAVALGAGIIEKHFTLDNKKIGMDNQMAIEVEEFGRLVQQCHNVHSALGCSARILTDSDKEMQMKMRRSVVTARKMSAGEVFKLEDLTAKRPGDGLPPGMISELVGKTLLKDLECEALVSLEDIK